MRGVIYMLVAVLFFSVMDALIKELSQSYSAFQVSFFRGAASLPFVIVWILLKGKISDLKSTHLHWHLIRGVMSVLFLVGVVIGLRELTIANAYTIFFAAPLLVAVLSIFLLNERVGLHRWGAIVLGMLGVIIALNPTAENLFNLGTLACLIAVIGYSFTVIIIKKMSATETTYAMVFYFLLSVSLGSGLLSLLDWHSLQWQHFGMIFCLGLSGAIGQFFITEAFKFAPASVIAPLDYSALIWGSLFGFLFWQEIPLTHVWIGAGVIILSGLYLMYRESMQVKN